MKNALSDILVDTNVLVYPYDPRDREKQEQARHVLERLITDGRAVTSVQCLTEFFRTVRWRLPEPLIPNDALLRVTRLSRLLRTLDLSAAVVLEGCRASNRYQLSLWDALIWAVAKLNQISQILTEDGEHGRVLEGVRYLNPFHPEFDLASLSA